MKILINTDYENYLTEGPQLLEIDHEHLSSFVFGKSVMQVGGGKTTDFFTIGFADGTIVTFKNDKKNGARVVLQVPNILKK